MKTTARRQIAVFAALLVACPNLLLAQRHSTEQVAGGVSYVKTDDHPSVNALGWQTSYSEYPYISFGWLGGTIEASGVYAHPAVRVAGLEINYATLPEKDLEVQFKEI